MADNAIVTSKLSLDFWRRRIQHGSRCNAKVCSTYAVDMQLAGRMMIYGRRSYIIEPRSQTLKLESRGVGVGKGRMVVSNRGNWRVDLPSSSVCRIDVLVVVVDVEDPLGRLGGDLRSGNLLCRWVTSWRGKRGKDG